MEYKLTMIQYYDAGQIIFPPYLQRSIQRWKKNGYIAKKQTGNKRETILKREHLMILAAYKPRQTPKHRNAQSLFVSIRQMDLCTPINKSILVPKMTRKKASTTAYQALTPRNEYLYDYFVSYNFPAGIRNVPPLSKLAILINPMDMG